MRLALGQRGRGSLCGGAKEWGLPSAVLVPLRSLFHGSPFQHTGGRGCAKRTFAMRPGRQRCALPVCFNLPMEHIGWVQWVAKLCG